MIDRSLPKVTHIIFDLDGLLIDTEPLFVEVNKRVMAKYGKKYTTDLKILTMGMTLNPGIELLLEKVSTKLRLGIGGGGVDHHLVPGSRVHAVNLKNQDNRNSSYPCVRRAPCSSQWNR